LRGLVGVVQAFMLKLVENLHILETEHTRESQEDLVDHLKKRFTDFLNNGSVKRKAAKEYSKEERRSIREQLDTGMQIYQIFRGGGCRGAGPPLTWACWAGLLYLWGSGCPA
jgi:hypothetical protein